MERARRLPTRHAEKLKKSLYLQHKTRKDEMKQLIACLLFCTSMIATAKSDTEYIVKPQKLTETITWEITADSTLRINGSGPFPNVNMEGKYWNKDKYRGEYTKVIIGEGITKTAFHAFYGFVTKLEVTLPSTLEIITDLSFQKCNFPTVELPSNLKSIGSSFYNARGAFIDCRFPGKVIVPESVTMIGLNAFYDCDFDEIVFMGNPTFYKDGATIIPDNQHKETKVVFMKKYAPVRKFIKGYYATRFQSMTIEIAEDSPEDFFGECTYPYKEELRGKISVITPSEKLRLKAKEESKESVTTYVAYHLGSWEDFLKGKTLPEIPDSETAKEDIATKVTQWQVKGEFETTAEWELRVNETTRSALIAKLSEEWSNKAKTAQTDYNRQYEIYKSEYLSKAKELQDEYFAELTTAANSEYKSDTYSLIAPYDADHGTFLISSESHGDFLLQVPRSEAQDFKANWQKISKSVNFSFAPDSECSVGLSHITFTNGGKQYIYDGKTDAAYSVANVDYNFKPIEISELHLDNIVLPEISDAPAIAQTVHSKGIEPKHVTIGQSAVKTAAEADVDRHIPSGSTQRQNTFALIIANENYNRVSPVAYAANDGKVFSKYVEQTLGVPQKNIFSLTDCSLNDMRYNLRRIVEICSAFGGDASVILYYAGHGVPDESNADAYLLPVDGYASDVTTGISLKEMISMLNELPAKQVTVFMDACFSGSGRDNQPLYSARSVAIKPKTVSVGGNVVMFSAAQGTESAAPYHQMRHGLFTYFLLDKLRESKGSATLGELSDHIIQNVKRTSVVEGKSQTPTVQTSGSMANWQSLTL